MPEASEVGTAVRILAGLGTAEADTEPHFVRCIFVEVPGEIRRTLKSLFSIIRTNLCRKQSCRLAAVAVFYITQS